MSESLKLWSSSFVEDHESETPAAIRFSWFLLPTGVFTLLCALAVMCGVISTINEGIEIFYPQAGGFPKFRWRHVSDLAGYVGQITVGILWGIAAVQWGLERTYIATIISVLAILAAIALPISFIT